MDLPKVSIIIPVYNTESYVEETIKSIQNQTLHEIEIIVVDDGSTDDSSLIINNFISSYRNIQFFSKKNGGPSSARNYGANFAQGNFLVFLDGDDKLHTTYVEKCISVYEKNQNLEIVYSDAEYFGLKTGVWKLPNFNLNTFLLDNCIPIFAMIKRESFLQVGKFDENLNYMEDWELWIRIIQNNNNVYKIPEILFSYRKSTENTSLTDLNEIKSDDIFDVSLLYIYNKHYYFYKNNSLSLRTLFLTVYEKERLKKKYYNIWYKKLIYKWFKLEKYKQIYEK